MAPGESPSAPLEIDTGARFRRPARPEVEGRTSASGVGRMFRPMQFRLLAAGPRLLAPISRGRQIEFGEKSPLAPHCRPLKNVAAGNWPTRPEVRRASCRLALGHFIIIARLARWPLDAAGPSCWPLSWTLTLTVQLRGQRRPPGSLGRLNFDVRSRGLINGPFITECDSTDVAGDHHHHHHHHYNHHH